MMSQIRNMTLSIAMFMAVPHTFEDSDKENDEGEVIGWLTLAIVLLGLAIAIGAAIKGYGDGKIKEFEKLK